MDDITGMSATEDSVAAGNNGGDGGKNSSTGDNAGGAALVNGRSVLGEGMTAGQQDGGEPGDGSGNAPGEPVGKVPDGQAGKDAGKEEYQLDVPPELGMSPEALAGLSAGMKGLSLSKEQAQGVIAMAAKNQQEALGQYAQQVERWGMEVKADKEMGGPQFEVTQRYAVAALRSFDSDGRLFGLLEQSGYSNHPEVIRFLSRAGKALGEDKAALGNGSGERPTLAERLYGNNTNSKG